jgi:hypothetical protein
MWIVIRRAGRAAEFRRVLVALAFAAALPLAGCQTEKEASMAAAQPRGATVAFESIDGLPQDRFHTLVQDLNGEAQLRRLAVLPREQPTAYRVRGYFAAAVEQGRTTVSWVWDVFDQNQRRATRISGSEDARSGKAWDVADDAMLQRIARASMEQLAAFLNAPDAAPAAPAPVDEPRLALTTDDSTPEAAGIFRIPHADGHSVATGMAPKRAAARVPLPPKRPGERSAAAQPATLLAAATR